MRPLAIASALCILASCRSRSAEQQPSQQRPPAAETAPAPPPTPCDPLLAEGARALDTWKRHATGVSEARWRAIASLNRCVAAEGGMWATVLDAPRGDAPRDAPAGRFKLVFVTDAGARAEAYPALVEDGDVFALRAEENNWSDAPSDTTAMGDWSTLDYDGDHVAEVVIPVTRRTEEGVTSSYVLVWKAASGRVEPFASAMGLHPVGTGDFDNDGRTDLVTHADLVATYINAAGLNTVLRGPRLAAVSRPGGQFFTSSGAALRHNRAECPSAPTRYFTDPDGGARVDAAKNVGCAMLWRVPPAQIVAALHRECPSAAVGVPNVCLGMLPGLEAMTRETPQADVREAVSFRYEEVPVIDAGTDAPRARYTLHVEGSGALFEPTVNLGELSGTCSVEDAAPARQVVAGLRCWWAGAGDEFQVIRRGTTLLVQRRTVDEESPPSPWRDVGHAVVNATIPLRPGEIE